MTTPASGGETAPSRPGDPSSPAAPAAPGRWWGASLPPRSLAGFCVALVAVLAMAVVSSLVLRTRSEGVRRMVQTMETTRQVEVVLSTLKDAETGQRGFLLTGSELFLAPYTASVGALPPQLAEARRLGAESPAAMRGLERIEAIVAEKLAELKVTIDLGRAGHADTAVALVRTGAGRATMDRLRAAVDDLLFSQRAELEARSTEWDRVSTLSMLVTWAGAVLLLFLIGAAAGMSAQAFRELQAHAWLRSGQNELSARLQGAQELEPLGRQIVTFVARYLGAQVGALYHGASGAQLRLVGGYALPAAGPEGERPAGGLTRQALQERAVLAIGEVPADYFPVTSGLGRSSPRHLVLAPASADGVANAVLELGFFHAAPPQHLELLRLVAEPIGVALRTAQYRADLALLLAQTQRQGAELQAQQDQLRRSNEELEAQGQTLQESAVRLEEQQQELQETNVSLEEQAQALEEQKDTLVQAQQALTAHADQLSRANQVKSEFLANMSHELRTPLNSALILSQVLADNASGNLSAEQVQFAQTIHGANVDLLTLINDILDLSKIEAGRSEVHPEPLSLGATIEQLRRTFAPLAAQKGLRFEVTLEDAGDDRLVSDGQRLLQVLKNLLSNAIKFTERGSVRLAVDAPGPSPGPAQVRFRVIDSGIGIAPEHQAVIFEAFRQADGSTHRKYGGTGLGLSISREFARLLGGEVSLLSEPGHGSTFTLTVPRVLGAPGAGAPAQAALATPPSVEVVRPAAGPLARLVEDDRDALAEGGRVLLVVEDDPAFASILVGLGRERGYQVLVVPGAEDGLAAARAHLPVAILLDVNLPDHSGLTLLDQLKRDPATRHLQVHVLSVEDHVRQALALGAAGASLKPVRREDLVRVLEALERRLEQKLSRLLVVEDDAGQRQALEALLGSGAVRVTSVGTAAAALEALHAATFDCLVVDLTLPDLSGFELLERLAAEAGAAHPPVIVYTGRSLEPGEEQRLSQYARSVIIKGPRSAERLLDEVALYLHQVEAGLPPDRQRLLRAARDRDGAFEGRRILLAEDDVRNVFALSRVLESRGATVAIARNGQEALDSLERSGLAGHAAGGIDAVLMDIMMPVMDGLTAIAAIRARPEWRALPIIALTAKAMMDDQQRCLAAGASDYLAKPFDVEKLLSLLRVWMFKR